MPILSMLFSFLPSGTWKFGVAALALGGAWMGGAWSANDASRVAALRAENAALHKVVTDTDAILTAANLRAEAAAGATTSLKDQIDAFQAKLKNSPKGACTLRAADVDGLRKLATAASASGRPAKPAPKP